MDADVEMGTDDKGRLTMTLTVTAEPYEVEDLVARIAEAIGELADR